MQKHYPISTNNNPQKKHLKILVVDNDAQIRNLLSNVLEEEGHKIEIAENSNEVLKKLAYSKYDILILNVNMPDMDGYRLSERLSKNILNRPKILIFTGRDILKEQVQFIVSGADAIIQKGVSIDKLTETIHNLFSIETKKKPISPQESLPVLKREPGQNSKNAFPKSTWHNKEISYDLQSEVKACEQKISSVEKLVNQRNQKYEQFIRDLLFEKQKTEKNFSELKVLKVKFKHMEKWLYALFAISLIALIKSFL